MFIGKIDLLEHLQVNGEKTAFILRAEATGNLYTLVCVVEQSIISSQ